MPSWSEVGRGGRGRGGGYETETEREIERERERKREREREKEREGEASHEAKSRIRPSPASLTQPHAASRRQADPSPPLRGLPARAPTASPARKRAALAGRRGST